MRLPVLIAPMTGVLFVACGNGNKSGTIDAGAIDAQVDLMDPDAMQLPDATQPPDPMQLPDAMQTTDAAPMLSVPDGTQLDQLTSDQVNALCTWMVDIQGGPHTVECDDGTKLTIDPAEDCLQNVWPHCEVGLLRTCVEAQAKDLCALAPAACTAFYECAGG